MHLLLRELYDISHASNCIKCKSYLFHIRYKCDECNIEYDKSDLYTIPKCSKHHYCGRCLNQSKPLHNKSKFCSGCDSFFEANQTERNSMQCNLCTNTDSLNCILRCDSHSYCEECYRFLLDNDSSQFPNISRCSYCKNRLERVKRLFQKSEGRNFFPVEIANISSEYSITICRKGHKYPENVGPDQLISKLDKNCPSCIERFLTLDNVSKCIFCESLNDVPTEMRCRKYKNLCKNCSLLQIEFSHIEYCDFCKVNLKEKIKQCSSCKMLHEVAAVYKIPKCTDHMFCKKCLSYSKSLGSYYCANCCCSAYFERNREVVFGIYGSNYNNKLCNLCGSPSVIFPEYCSRHGYCEFCSDFISINDWSEFPSMKSCEECKKSISSKQMKALPKETPREDKRLSSGEMVKCDLNHVFMMADIFMHEFDIKQAIKNCTSCRTLFLKMPGINVCIFCDNALETYRYVCDIYRNICDSCYPTEVEPGHIDCCVTCAVQHKDIYYKCDNCRKYEVEKNLFQVPKCERHVFCVKCLSTEDNARISCERCISYFENIGKYNKMGCNLCAVWPDSKKISCEVHSYCKICSEFLLSKHFSIFPNVKRCEKCMISIKALPSPESTSISTPHIQNPLENIPQYEPQPLTNQYKFDNFSQNISDPHSQPPPSHQDNFEIANDPLPANNPPLVISNNIQSNPDHFSSHNTQFIPTQNPLHSNLIPNNNIHVPLNSVTGEFKNTGVQNYYEESKDREFYSKGIAPRVKTATDYELERNQEATAKMLEKLSLLPVCSNCRNTQIYCTLECDHNCCSECLVFACSFRIYRFFAEYENDKGVINRRFRYVCPVGGCNKNISVPTDMIIKMINGLLKQNESVFNRIEFNNYKSTLEYIAACDLRIWMPYFDGIKPFIVVRCCT